MSSGRPALARLGRAALALSAAALVAACSDYLVGPPPAQPVETPAAPLENEETDAQHHPETGEPVIARDAGPRADATAATDAGRPPGIPWEPPVYEAPAASGPGHVLFQHPDHKYRRVRALPGSTPEILDTALDLISPGEDARMNISRDGNWLVAETSRFGCGADLCLAVYNGALTAGEAVIVRGAHVQLGDSMIAIGAKGKLIVYGGGGAHDTDLYSIVKTAAGWSEPRVLTAASPKRYNQRPALSPDSRKVVFDCGDEDSAGNELTSICEVNVDGTGFRILQAPTGILNLHSPAYTPDGHVVMEHEAPGIGEVVYGEQIYQLDPTNPATSTPLDPSYSNDNSPCVLPNGNIASLWLQRPENSDGYHELRMMSPTGTPLGMLVMGVEVIDIGLGCSN